MRRLPAEEAQPPSGGLTVRNDVVDTRDGWKSTREQIDYKQMVAVVRWARAGGWTVESDPDRICRFYDPHGDYTASWSSAAPAEMVAQGRYTYRRW